MNKIGILTLHFVDNYGAVLQAYSLRCLLMELYNIDVDIINFVWDSKPYVPYCVDMTSQNKYIKKRKDIERFMNEKCGINSPFITSLDGLDYDCYCV